MANISDAHGTFTIDPKVYKQNQKEINKVLNTINGTEIYGVNDIDFTGGGEFNFAGSGRWSFDNLLEDPFGGNILPNVPQIKFDYYDYEPGSEFIAHQKATIMLDGETTLPSKQKHLYKLTDLKTNQLDYTDRNLIKYDFEEGVDVDDSDQVHWLKSAVSDYYMDQPDKFQNNISEADLVGKVVNYIKNDSRYDGCILNWKLEDYEAMGDLIEESLNA